MPEIFKGFFDVKKESIHIKGKPYQMAPLVTGNPSNMEFFKVVMLQTTL